MQAVGSYCPGGTWAGSLAAHFASEALCLPVKVYNRTDLQAVLRVQEEQACGSGRKGDDYRRSETYYPYRELVLWSVHGIDTQQHAVAESADKLTRSTAALQMPSPNDARLSQDMQCPPLRLYNQSVPAVAIDGTQAPLPLDCAAPPLHTISVGLKQTWISYHYTSLSFGCSHMASALSPHIRTHVWTES